MIYLAYMNGEILFLKNYLHVECLFTLAGGAGYFSVEANTGKLG